MGSEVGKKEKTVWNKKRGSIISLTANEAMAIGKDMLMTGEEAVAYFKAMDHIVSLGTLNSYRSSGQGPNWMMDPTTRAVRYLTQHLDEYMERVCTRSGRAFNIDECVLVKTTFNKNWEKHNV